MFESKSKPKSDWFVEATKNVKVPLSDTPKNRRIILDDFATRILRSSHRSVITVMLSGGNASACRKELWRTAANLGVTLPRW